MSTYNILRTEVTCPHCHVCAMMEIELRFGDTRAMAVYAVGDRYLWLPKKAVRNGGRPENGSLDGEGYTTCPSCHRDFFVTVVIRADQIKGAIPDTQKIAYVNSADAGSTLPAPEAPLPAWDPAAYAARMRKSTFPVSTFFLIDSPEAFSRCIQWLTLLEPFGMPGMEDSEYFKNVHRIYQANSVVVNDDFDFRLRWQDKEFQGLLRCHFIEKGKYEIELWLPGVLANELADQFRDGHTGFFCAFMPPLFYD